MLPAIVGVTIISVEEKVQWLLGKGEEGIKREGVTTRGQGLSVVGYRLPIANHITTDCKESCKEGKPIPLGKSFLI